MTREEGLADAQVQVFFTYPLCMSAVEFIDNYSSCMHVYCAIASIFNLSYSGHNNYIQVVFQMETFWPFRIAPSMNAALLN